MFGRDDPAKARKKAEKIEARKQRYISKVSRRFVISEAARDIINEHLAGEEIVLVERFSLFPGMKANAGAILALSEDSLHLFKLIFGQLDSNSSSHLISPTHQSFRLSEIASVTELPGAFTVETRSGETLHFRTDLFDSIPQWTNAIRKRMDVLATGGKAAQASDAVQALGRLAELKKEGVFTEAEWTRAKELFLGKGPNKNDEAISLLKNLFGLHKSGVLSEGEFNMKKWDILSRN